MERWRDGKKEAIENFGGKRDKYPEWQDSFMAECKTLSAYYGGFILLYFYHFSIQVAGSF